MTSYSSLLSSVLLLQLCLPAVVLGFSVLAPSTTTMLTTPLGMSAIGFDASLFDLFDGEEDEMIPIAEHYVHARYQQYARDHAKEVCNQEDIAVLLKSLLPPVTTQELKTEVDATLQVILQNPANTPDAINEDCFVKAIVQNSYWRNAGSLVVKELMFFDALYSYYQTGSSLLNNEDYEELKENLTWEGSSVATMNRQECMFVNAVAASKRGEPILSDDEYKRLKEELKGQNSWVVSRGQDALEKLGLDTFLGYLHRALS